jgi:hypothetical protein
MGTYVYSTGETCYDAVEARPATDPVVTVDLQLGWNSTARSIDTIAANTDGLIEFTTGTPVGVICGITPSSVDGTSTSPWDCTHAFYITATEIFIYEPVMGYSSLSAFGALSVPEVGKLYRIQRTSGVVKYYVNDVLVYTSTRMSTEEVYMDASLYRASDYVENPFIGAGTPVFASGFFEISAPAADAHFWGSTTGIGAFPATVGTITLASANDRIMSVDMPLPAFTSTLTLTNYLHISATTPALDVKWSNKIYAGFDGELPAPTVLMNGTTTNYANIAWFLPQLPPVIGYLHGWASYPISIDTTLPAIDCMFSGDLDSPADFKIANFGRIGAPMLFQSPVMRAYFDDGFGDWFSYEIFEVLGVRVAFSGDNILHATLPATLTNTFEITATLITDDTQFDETLTATESWEIGQILYALIQDGFTISNRMPEQEMDLIQYAVNAATGALSTYRDFGFTAFYRVGADTYAIKPGGLYKLEYGADDDGIPFSAHIDFGDSDFGTAARKNIDSLYLGMNNSGEVFARLTTDAGDDNYYTVTQTTPTARVIAGRGVSARRWGLRLDIIDAGAFELDNVEFSVGVATNRRMP